VIGTPAMKTKTERHVFSALSAQARTRLVEEIVQWGLSVWNSTAEDLRGYWLETKSYDTNIYLLRTEDGRLVGSSTFKYYRVDYEGKAIVVVKLGLGVDPKHRGNKFAMRCAMLELLYFKLAHPRTPFYVFSTLIHPVTYKLCCDLLGDRLYPYFKRPDNPEMQKMAAYLAERFGVEKADSPHPFVYRERFSPAETQTARDYWRNNPRPEVRFYVEHCPNYDCSDDCLIGLALLEVTHMIPLGMRTLVRNRMDRWRGRKPRFA
jgi:hypothetical protein